MSHMLYVWHTRMRHVLTCMRAVTRVRAMSVTCVTMYVTHPHDTYTNVHAPSHTCKGHIWYTYTVKCLDQRYMCDWTQILRQLCAWTHALVDMSRMGVFLSLSFSLSFFLSFSFSLSLSFSFSLSLSLSFSLSLSLSLFLARSFFVTWCCYLHFCVDPSFLLMH